MLNKQNKLGTYKICLSSKDGKGKKKNSILEMMEHKEDKEEKMRPKDFQPSGIREKKG